MLPLAPKLPSAETPFTVELLTVSWLLFILILSCTSKVPAPSIITFPEVTVPSVKLPALALRKLAPFPCNSPVAFILHLSAKVVPLAVENTKAVSVTAAVCVAVAIP